MKKLSKEQIQLLNDINENWYLSNIEFEKLNNQQNNIDSTNIESSDIESSDIESSNIESSDNSSDTDSNQNDNTDQDDYNELNNNMWMKQYYQNKNIWMIQYNKFKKYVEKKKELPRSTRYGGGTYSWYMKQKNIIIKINYIKSILIYQIKYIKIGIIIMVKKNV